MFYFGWTTLMIIPIPILIAVMVALLWARTHPDRHGAQPAFKD